MFCTSALNVAIINKLYVNFCRANVPKSSDK
nr:MAG TPA: hypothetical protein [Caudoviricetes sp.]